ncbi:hypothetical protein C8R43DRAFT_1013241 [Mycena crocata]|nr:hypothetical protein C8R43DRAFT_1013241 [Mycena crocata]
MLGPHTTTRPRPYPWPWGQPSIIITNKEEERRRANYWLDAKIREVEDDDGSDYVPSENTSDTESSSSGSSDSADSEGIPESEVETICEDAKSGWHEGWNQPTPSEKEFDQKEDQARQLVDLVKAEQDAVAAYNPDLFVSLVTQLYELLIDMGHWPQGSLAYPPHPTLNETLAEELGYDAAVISLMQRLPYIAPPARIPYIVDRTPFADYRDEWHLKEGRRPYPYQYLDGCPDLDAWMLPLTLPNRDGWNIMLDTRLGVVRAYCADAFIPDFETAEFRRQGVVADLDEWEMCGRWTEYRRAPLVPAAVYFSEIIDAYRSLKRLPMVEPYLSDPNEPHPAPEERRREREEKMTLLNLYRECGWPDQWQRAEFVAKWETSKEEIRARFDTARLKDKSRRVNAPDDVAT